MSRRSPIAKSGGLCFDVADALIGDPDIGKDDRQDLLIDSRRLVKLHRRQAQTFLLDFGGMGRKSARHHAAGVGPVAGIGEPSEMAAAIEERLDELDVHQMRAAEIGIVDDENVAFADGLCALDHRLGRELHRADEDRQAELALRDQLAGIPRR